MSVNEFAELTLQAYIPHMILAVHFLGHFTAAALFWLLLYIL